jgi:hypothetical protein
VADQTTTSDGLGGLDGLLPLLLLTSGKKTGLTPLLFWLLLLRHTGGETTTTTTGTSGGDVDPNSFTDFLTANVGRRVKLVLATQTWVTAGQVITARIVEVGSDYVTLDRICINGTPVLDPRRITIRIATILAVEALTFRDQLIELLCILD